MAPGSESKISLLFTEITVASMSLFSLSFPKPQFPYSDTRRTRGHRQCKALFQERNLRFWKPKCFIMDCKHTCTKCVMEGDIIFTRLASKGVFFLFWRKIKSLPSKAVWVINSLEKIVFEKGLSTSVH